MREWDGDCRDDHGDWLDCIRSGKALVAPTISA